MEVQGDLVVKIVMAVAAVLIGISGWLIITGRYDRYNKRVFRDPLYKKWLKPSDQNDKSTKT